MALVSLCLCGKNYIDGLRLDRPKSIRVAAITGGENGMMVQNVEISLWQKQGGRSGYVPERQQ